jgi:hypothetical protein
VLNAPSLVLDVSKLASTMMIRNSFWTVANLSVDSLYGLLHGFSRPEACGLSGSVALSPSIRGDCVEVYSSGFVLFLADDSTKVWAVLPMVHHSILIDQSSQYRGQEVASLKSTI